MVFEKFKEDVVVAKGWTDKKGCAKFAKRLALLCLLVGVGVGTVALSTVGVLVAVIVLCASGFLFIWLIDMSDEDEETFKKMNKVSKFWWLTLILDILVVLVLKFFRFL